MRAVLCSLTAVALCLVGAFAILADEEKIPLDKVPKSVMDAVKKRFPNAEITGAEKETEDGKTSFEIAIKDGGSKIDVEVTGEGVITEFEKEMKASDLPKAVTEAIEGKYAKSTLKTVEQVMKVKDGEEKLEFYEVIVETADNKKFEVCVSAEGKIVKEEEKGKKKD
jgi:uncharacterized membrane protein YkoI